MTNPLYDQPPTPNDDQFYPIYPEFYDFSNAGHSTAGHSTASAATGGGGTQPAPGFPETGQIEGGYPPGWNYGLGDVELAFPPSPLGIIRGEEGHGIQPQAPWNCGTQAYQAMMGGGTMAMASPVSQYPPAGKPLGGCYEPLDWPRPPMGQISPSPSQSSYHASSPASAAGPQFSRHNSCSSLPASRAAAVEQTRFDARFPPVPDHAVSTVETVASNGLHPGTESSSSARQKAGSRRNARNQTMTATTTADYNAGTLSPAITPSPKDSTAAVPHQPVSQSARRPSTDQKTSKSSGKRALQPAIRRTTQQKQQAETTSRGSQGQKPQPQAQSQAQSQPSPQAAPATQRTRSREAANKCRAKTKLAVADLESTERAMSTEHRELSATARGLRDEVLLLKNELLAHGNCDDSLIQQYLTNQARMVGNGATLQRDLHRHQQQQHH